MDADEKRARDLAAELREWVGATVVQKAVIFINQGAPTTSQFTMYDEADLQKAFDLGLLHKRTLKIHSASRTDTIDIMSSNEGPTKKT
jgi:hypothetical protein